uniref:Peptidase C1A papain C-terminal domain-containing protein n=1 Tax=viral metagenome TaxID=1070528 RepID=A0A6C0ECM7_9ZZZZ
MNQKRNNKKPVKSEHKYLLKRGQDLDTDNFHLFSLKSLAGAKLPTSVDLRSNCPTVFDQGALGSCTANALASAYQFVQIKNKTKNFVPSRLFIYYNERMVEGTTKEDAGAELRTGINVMTRYGVCPETMWPYNINQFTVRPRNTCYNSGVLHKVTTSKRVGQTLSQLKQCLANGFPFVIGIAVFDSFESDAVSRTGIVPMPNTSTESLLGGHALLCVGYNDATGRFIVRNSWGTSWGDAGYCHIPYAYLTNASLAGDFWTISAVNDKRDPNVP